MGKEVTLPKQMDWRLNEDEISTLLLTPAFSSESPLSGNFSVLRNVKVDATMHKLNRPKRFLQSNDNCGFTPKGKMQLTSRKITVARMKVNLQFCVDELFDTCLERITGAGNDIKKMDSTKALKALKAAMMEQVQQGLIDDIFAVAYFGKVTNTISDADLQSFFALMNGIWEDIFADVTAGNTPAQTGVSGSALSSGDSVDLFDDTYGDSKLPLKKFKKNFLVYNVTSTVYENYLAYLQALGTEMANQLIIDGVQVGLKYNGIPVIEHPEWDDILVNEYGLTLPHRVQLTVQGNDTLATDISGESTSLRVYSDIDEEFIKIKGELRLGAREAHPELNSVAY